MICEDLVNLTDDDNITEIITDKNKINNKSTPVIDTIILDDESQHNITENNNIITIINDDVNSKSTNNLFTAVSRENKLLGEFIEICLKLENSTGMGRVINNTLIKSYMETNKSYKNSVECMRVLRKAIISLETTPHLKFSHVKNLSETFKSKRFKKRAKLTTLVVNLTDRPEITEFTKPKTIIIDSDEEQAPVINLDEDQNDVIILDTPMAVNDEKENKSEENNYLISEVEVTWEPHSFASTVDTEQKVPETPTPEMEKIKIIEKQIEYYKEMINALEETEVDDDSKNSPYLKCERMKSKIVSLYSELCQLTGSEAVKRREVRLRVLEGHPAGPMRKLEKFINENIGSDGDPPFPDFNDVVNCVAQSNVEDNMGWGRHDILKEASALFTQCGRALQKRRQKREWRDLLQRVKTEAADADPADQDPELLARLDENRRIAVKKEKELLERFSMMQDRPKPPSLVVPSKSPASNAMEQSIESGTDTNTVNHRNEENDPNLKMYEVNESSSQEKSKTYLTEVNETKIVLKIMKPKPYREIIDEPKGKLKNIETINDANGETNQSNSKETSETYSTEVHESKRLLEIMKPKPYIQIMDEPKGTLENNEPMNDTNGETNESNSKDKSETPLSKENGSEMLLETNKPFIQTVDEPSQLVNNETKTETNVTKELNILNTEVKIKIEKEHIDIISQLEQLGDNFTISVADIEDPFLVIEVSSDSEDEDYNKCDDKIT